MKVLILGGGGREHALAWRLASDPDVSTVLTAPGNPGTARHGSNCPINIGQPDEVLALVRRERVDLTVVGPEAPLERGVADVLRREGCLVVGPSARGAALECSKAHAKAFMARHAIPTARFVTTESLDEALDATSGGRFGFPVVVKADGLAAGKGVTVAQDRDDAHGAVRAAMVDRQFGAAGARLVIEEFLTGPEVSMFYLLDGTRAVSLGSAQDHKRIFDDDRGPNTGGMGAFAPSPLVTEALEAQVLARVVEPVLEGHRAAGDPYCGFLYVSLMLTPDGPKVIEFNVRFGDPEAQAVLPLVEGRFAALLESAARGRVNADLAGLSRDRTVGVVLASRGYPAGSESGRAITGLDAAEAVPGVTVFHAGTSMDNGHLVTAGGRVLTVVGRAGSYAGAMDLAYDAVGRIEFDGMQYRRDIGRKARAVDGD